MNLTGIVESGSTKADWVFLDGEGIEKFRTNTNGFNPLLISQEDITAELNANAILQQIKENVGLLHFYGAGCKSEQPVHDLKISLKRYFSKAEIHVKTDLDAACFAVYQGEPCIVGILGTGSNACFFDGTEPEINVPSLGYVLGDEGSGNHIGRELLKAFLYHRMPENLYNQFRAQFETDLNVVLENIYKKPKANAYLADFSHFAYRHKEDSYIQNLLITCFKAYVENSIMPYRPKTGIKINLVGSVAYYFNEILEEVFQKNKLKINKIIHKPIDGLIAFHSQQG